MVSTAQLEIVARIGAVACECAKDDAFANILLKELETLFNADGAVFYDMSGPFAKPSFGQSTYLKIDPAYGILYRDHYNQLDPCFATLQREARHTHLATASTLRAIANPTDYVETEYYQDFLKPQRIHTSIIFTISNGDGLLGLFGFQRPAQADGFDDESHLLVRLIAAPIAQALDLRRRSLNDDISGDQAGVFSLSVANVSLTPRQTEISKLITLGLTNREIAAQLNIVEKTVENHLTRIYELTQADNRVMLAQSLGALLSPPVAKQSH